MTREFVSPGGLTNSPNLPMGGGGGDLSSVINIRSYSYKSSGNSHSVSKMCRCKCAQISMK